MEGLKLFLEGPGQELRAVQLDSTETVTLQAMGFSASTSMNRPVEFNVLVDAEGNLARQVDREGYRYKFNVSEITWSLSVG